MPKRIRLYEERGGTSRSIEAEIVEGGDLLVVRQDVGKASREWWGDGDYEFWVSVASERIDDVLLALLGRLYGGSPLAVDDFREFLESRGVSFEFATWV